MGAAWRAGLAIATLALGWAVVSGAPVAARPLSADPTASPTPDPFLVAERLAESGLRSAAVEAARDALKVDPGRTLGPRTREAISSSSPTPTADPFAVAETLAVHGLRSDALQAAKDAAKVDPQRTFGPETRRILDEDAFAAAIRLADAGFDDKAAEVAKAALAVQPGRTLPPRLAYLDADQLNNPFASRSARLDSVLTNAGAWLLFFLVLLLVVVPIAPRLFLALPLLPWLLSLVRRGVMAPQGRLWSWFADHVLRWVFFLWVVEPRIRVSVSEHSGQKDEVAETVPKIDQAIAVAVETELRLLGEEGGSASTRLTRVPDQKLDIPQALAELPWQGKFLSGLASLLPHNDHVLSLTMQPRGERGVGLTASVLGPRGHILATVMLSEKGECDPDYAPPTGDKEAIAASAIAAYQRLAVAAASWAIYQPPISVGGRAPRGALTEVWKSYVAHRLGAWWQENEQPIRARRLYEKALDADPENVGSLLNVAVLDWDDTDRARAEERLREARRLVTRSGQRRDRGWYRIHYNLAALLLERVLENGGPLPTVAAGIDLLEQLKDAERVLERQGTPDEVDLVDVKPTPALAFEIEALDLVEELSVRVLAAAESDTRGATPELKAFIRLIEAMSAVILASAWLALRRRRTALPADLPARFRPRSNARDPEYVIDALEPRAAQGRDVRYNLACYFAQAGALVEALEELKHGLRPGDDESAREDPALKPLHTSPEFEKVLAKYAKKGPAVAKPALATVGSIGERWAARLKDKSGVTDVDRLMRRVASPEARRTLAEEIGAPPALVDQWAELLRLRVLPGIVIGIGQAELLYRAGIRTAEQLGARRDAGPLADLMRALNEVHEVVAKAPTEAEVQTWIEAARLAHDPRVPIGGGPAR